MNEKLKNYIYRFAESVQIICGARPPENLVVDWLNFYNNDLQHWVVENSKLEWAQGTGILDAALELTENPIEGKGFELEFRET